MLNEDASAHALGLGAAIERDRFRRLVDDIGAILWEAELPSWRFTFVSHRAEGILGYPLRQWLEEENFWVNHIHPEDRQRVVDLCASCSERGESCSFEYRAVVADGSIIWLRAVVQVVSDGEGPRQLCGVMVDITESKRAEDDLGVRTAQLAAVSNAMLSFLETGEWRTASAGLLRTAIEQTESEYGFIGVVVGKTLRVLAHEGIEWDEDVGRELYEDALRLYAQRGYLEFTSLDNLFGHVVTEGIAVLANNPSSDARYGGGLPPGHPPLNAFLGVPIFSADEVIGLVGIANRDGGYTGSEHDKIEIICRAIGVLYESYVRDLRRKELERERRSLEDQLNQSQKMEALGQLAGGIAHDFNNLLTAILGNADLLAECSRPTLAAPDHLGMQKAIEEIRKASERAAELTRQLLVFGRRQAQITEVVDLRALVRDFLEMLKRLIGEHIQLELETSPDAVAVVADKSQLEQVLMNLALNARDAMPKGGRLGIRVGTERHPMPGRDDIEPLPWAVLTVSDTGSGIDSATRERIFEPFFTTKPVGQGTGLGLATVYGIVTQVGGRIHVESEPDEGSTFRVLLRIAGAAPEEAPTQERDAASGDQPPGAVLEKSPATIVVCEDDPAVRRMMCAILESSGYRILEAESAPDALRLILEHPDPVDLLVTDIVMPNMNGIALADRIQMERPEVKVLLVSGYTRNWIDPPKTAGTIRELLRKPFSAEQLVDRARSLLKSSVSG